MFFSFLPFFFLFFLDDFDDEAPTGQAEGIVQLTIDGEVDDSPIIGKSFNNNSIPSTLSLVLTCFYAFFFLLICIGRPLSFSHLCQQATSINEDVLASRVRVAQALELKTNCFSLVSVIRTWSLVSLYP